MVLVLLTVGCLQGDNLSSSEWTAEIYKGKEDAYSEEGAGFSAFVLNPSGGEAGTRDVCLFIDERKTSCNEVSLIPGEDQAVGFRAAYVEPGNHTVRVLNDTKPLHAVKMPRPGDWINGTYLDARLTHVDLNKSETKVYAQFEFRWINGSEDLVGVKFQSTLDRYLPHNKTWNGSTGFISENTPLKLIVSTDEDLNRTFDPWGGLYQWWIWDNRTLSD